MSTCRCHPNLRFCPGPNCDIVIKAEESVAKNTVCHACKSRFCFKCGNSYHAPTGETQFRSECGSQMRSQS